MCWASHNFPFAWAVGQKMNVTARHRDCIPAEINIYWLCLGTSSDFLRLNPEEKREKTYRIKANNQEELIRKQNESDATS